MNRFVLIPESEYRRQNPVKSLTERVVYDPTIDNKSKIYSTLPKQRFAKKIEIPTVSNSTQFTQVGNPQIERILSVVNDRKKQCKIILDRITANDDVSISPNDEILVYGAPSGLKIGTFLHKLQLLKTRFSDLERDVFIRLIRLLDLTDNLVRNKTILAESKEVPEIEEDIQPDHFTPVMSRGSAAPRLTQSAPIDWNSMWPSDSDEND